MAKARQARLSPSISQQSIPKSPKMTTTKESTDKAERVERAQAEEKANASDDESEYSSLDDDDDTLGKSNCIPLRWRFVHEECAHSIRVDVCVSIFSFHRTTRQRR